MDIAVHAVDSLIPNVALMKLSAWHQSQGDTVSLLNPLFASAYPPDRLYLSKQFDFTPDIDWWPNCEIIRGGTGYDHNIRLTDEQDTTYPDYDLYNCKTAIGRITRGCPRKCPWCVVPGMDGNRVHQVAELDDFWRGQEVVRLLDDNLTANHDLFVKTCERLTKEKVKVNFDALDIRFMNTDAAKALSTVRLAKNVHFAFDSMAVEKQIINGINNLKAGGMKLYKCTFYVLIGFDTTPEEDMHRIKLLDSMGVESFVMPFDKSDPYQRRLARWCNMKAVFRSTSFENYK